MRRTRINTGGGRRGMDRRMMLAGLGATALAAGFARYRFAGDSAPRDEALWFEWTDGAVYRHEVVVDEEGFWLEGHDGYWHRYADMRPASQGVWLKLPDETYWEHHWCVTDEEAEERLQDFHWVSTG